MRLKAEEWKTEEERSEERMEEVRCKDQRNGLEDREKEEEEN